MMVSVISYGNWVTHAGQIADDAAIEVKDVHPSANLFRCAVKLDGHRDEPFHLRLISHFTPNHRLSP